MLTLFIAIALLILSLIVAAVCSHGFFDQLVGWAFLGAAITSAFFSGYLFARFLA